MKKRRRARKRKRIRMMVLFVTVAVVVLLLTAAAGRDDSGQQGEAHEEIKSIEAMSSRTQTADTLTETAAPEQEKEFEEWVKPHIEGMIPVYGRAGIDYISLDDFELMGKTVFAEAKTEEFAGQVAVAEIILNRVESENFPDTVQEVIKQDGAFSSWGNGSVEAAPFDDECLEAVQDAVNERFFPDSVVYFREGHFHSFGTPYTVIGHHYFSSEEGEGR